MKIIKPIKEYNLNKEYLHEMQINEKFIMNDNKYIAIVSTEFNCTKCSFRCRRECTSVRCYRNERSDAQSIIFEKVT